MDPQSDACAVCGCTEKVLHSGFYYCPECGTQDEKLQETVVETVIQSDNTVGVHIKKKIRLKTNIDQEMSNSWYIWHGFNFIFHGVADEMITKLGVKPSFKKKLLWVWTKYMKMYMNSEELGLAKALSDEDNENENTKVYSESEPEDDFVERILKKRSEKVKTLTFKVVIAIISIALNMDESVIQDSHLIRFLHESRLSIPFNIKNLIPPEIKPDIIKNKYRVFQWNFVVFSNSELAKTKMTLFRTLKLGTPTVPDLRSIVNDYLKELCLPDCFKPLVYSLLEYSNCEYMDIIWLDRNMKYTPDYQLECLIHIIFAMKLCFGLDDYYDGRLSDTVDKINSRENYPKVYTIGNTAHTDRLFSLKEWCKYIQFRNIMLQENCIFLCNKHSDDMNISVAVEQVVTAKEQDGAKPGLKDEITVNVVNSIPGGDCADGVIPKSQFKHTTTPHSCYTQVIVQHLKDPEVKLALSEDFTKYSAEYVTRNFELLDPDTGENVVTGINKEKREIKKLPVTTEFSNWHKMFKPVYVRNCDNHNWVNTCAPTTDHIVSVAPETEPIIDQGAAAEPENETSLEPKAKKRKINNNKDDAEYVVVDVANDEVNTDKLENPERKQLIDSILSQAEENNDEEDVPLTLETIEEEDEGVNIFDDDFTDLNKTKKEPDIDDEVPHADNETFHDTQNTINYPNFEEPNNGYESDNSVDSVINLKQFERGQAIKELILHACKKYSISVPKEYKPKTSTDRSKSDRNKYHQRGIKKYLKDMKQLSDNVISAYNDMVSQDPMIQLGNYVQKAIQNATNVDPDINDSVENSVPPEFEEPSRTEPADDETSNIIMNDETSNIIMNDENSEDEKLFNESSDEETYGEKFLPEKHPDFDEDVYNPKQLYLKVEGKVGNKKKKSKKKKVVPETEVELDEELTEVVERKRNQDVRDPTRLEDKEDSYNSEEDMPITDRKLLRKTIRLRSKKKSDLEPLLDKKHIPEMNYWHQLYLMLYKLRESKKAYKDSSKEMPKSFEFFIEQCAIVSGYTRGFLCNKLQNLEMKIFDKCGLETELRGNEKENSKPNKARKNLRLKPTFSRCPFRFLRDP